MPETTGSLGTYLNRLFFYRRRNRLVMLLEACQVALDGILDICQRLLPGLAFRNAPGQGTAPCNFRPRPARERHSDVVAGNAARRN
jgi:hypothetical protein